MSKALHKIETFDPQTHDLNVIIETPKGNRNKFKYDTEKGLMKLGSVLPVGAVFPYDFGFLPSTEGQDGDPMDVLLLMDEPAFVGCLVAARLIGVIEAEQTEDGKTTRNDRLIAVSVESRDQAEVKTLDDLDAHRVDEIAHFFVSYNQTRGKEFKPLGRYGPDRAVKLVAEGQARFRGK
jgi:inorganic pyrophosphatase